MSNKPTAQPNHTTTIKGVAAIVKDQATVVRANFNHAMGANSKPAAPTIPGGTPRK
jgi:hypothetical protein